MQTEQKNEFSYQDSPPPPKRERDAVELATLPTAPSLGNLAHPDYLLPPAPVHARRNDPSAPPSPPHSEPASPRYTDTTPFLPVSIDRPDSPHKQLSNASVALASALDGTASYSKVPSDCLGVDGDGTPTSSSPFPAFPDLEQGCSGGHDSRGVLRNQCHRFYTLYMKGPLCCFYTLFFGGLSLYTMFCGIYHTTVLAQYDPTPFVTSYNYNSAAPDKIGKVQGISRLQHFANLGLGTPDRPIKVMLAGDSLVNNPWIQKYNLHKKLKLSEKKTNIKQNIQWINHAMSACVVKNLMEDRWLPTWIRNESPDLVLILSNSDVSMSKSSWPKAKWDDYKANYRVAIENLLSFLDAKMGQNYAFSGPSVLTEGIGFLAPPRQRGFGFMVKDIRDINLEYAVKHNATYIDMFKAIKSISVPWWILYSSYATVDGEHYNELGSQMLADTFVQALLNPMPTLK